MEELYTQRNALKRQMDEIDGKIREINEKRKKDASDRVAHVPVDIADISKLFKSKKVTKKDAEEAIRQRWCVKGRIIFKGQEFNRVVEEFMCDVEDYYCRVLMNLRTCELLGPFKLLKEKKIAEADRLEEQDHIICVFSK